MIEAVKVMSDLGYIETTDEHDDIVVRQFSKFNKLGYKTDTINFIYNGISDVDVFTNDLTYGCGSRLDSDLIKAITLNIIELKGVIK